MADTDAREWREAMIDWMEQVHGELRLLRLMAQVVFVLWLLGLVLGAIAFVASD